MPAPQLKSFSDKSGKPMAEVEKLWDKTEKIANDSGKTKSKGEDAHYAYRVGILKNMLSIEGKIAARRLIKLVRAGISVKYDSGIIVIG